MRDYNYHVFFCTNQRQHGDTGYGSSTGMFPRRISYSMQLLSCSRHRHCEAKAFSREERSDVAGSDAAIQEVRRSEFRHCHATLACDGSRRS